MLNMGCLNKFVTNYIYNENFFEKTLQIRFTVNAYCGIIGI